MRLVRFLVAKDLFLEFKTTQKELQICITSEVLKFNLMSFKCPKSIKTVSKNNSLAEHDSVMDSGPTRLNHVIRTQLNQVMWTFPKFWHETRWLSLIGLTHLT